MKLTIIKWAKLPETQKRQKEFEMYMKLMRETKPNFSPTLPVYYQSRVL